MIDYSSFIIHCSLFNIPVLLFSLALCETLPPRCQRLCVKQYSAKRTLFVDSGQLNPNHLISLCINSFLLSNVCGTALTLALAILQ